MNFKFIMKCRSLMDFKFIKNKIRKDKNYEKDSKLLVAEAGE